jgi:hypothetical protein
MWSGASDISNNVSISVRPTQKKIGAWAVMCVEEGLEAVAIAVLTRFGKWSPLEVRILVAKAKLELKSAALHSMLGLYVAPPLEVCSVSANLCLS